MGGLVHGKKCGYLEWTYPCQAERQPGTLVFSDDC
jgi:hypothetical protein